MMSMLLSSVRSPFRDRSAMPPPPTFVSSTLNQITSSRASPLTRNGDVIGHGP